MKLDFEGYWSEKDKEIWEQTDWKARNYEELPVGEEIVRDGYFYGDGPLVKKPMIFVKYLRANPIYGPYYGPVKNKDNYEKSRGFVGSMYDGREEGPYPIHDRFETQELYDWLST